MTIARVKRARVNINYLVEFDGRYYSVPHRLVRSDVELRVAGTMVEVLAVSQRLAVQLYSARRGGRSTTAELLTTHQPAGRRNPPGKSFAWGSKSRLIH